RGGPLRLLSRRSYGAYIRAQGGGEGEKVFVAPGAGEVAGDLGDGLAAPRIAMRREAGRIALARYDGPHDRHPRAAADNRPLSPRRLDRVRRSDKKIQNPVTYALSDRHWC